MRVLAVALLVVAAAAAAGCSGHADPRQRALDRAMGYLEAHAAHVGPPYLLEAAVAAGKDPLAWPADGPAHHRVAMPANATFESVVRPAFALSRVPGLPDRDAIYNRMAQGFDGRQFGDPALQDDDAFAVWALAAIVPDWHLAPWSGWADSLLRNQTAQGGWSWSTNGTADVDSTGMALSALASAAGSNASRALPTHLAAARAYLAGAIAPDGGYPSQPGGGSNCDSTVWGLRGATVAGLGGQGKAWSFLLGLQRGDGGFAYLPSDTASNNLCTAEAATLLGDALHGRLATPTP